MKSSSFKIIIFFVVLMIIGAAVIPLLPVQLEPSGEMNTVTISYSWPNASAELLEGQVTAKVEGALATIKGIKNISSSSSEGYGYINAELNDDTNTGQTRYEIATLVRHIYKDLPPGLSYPSVTLNNPSFSAGRTILSYTLDGPGSASLVSDFAREHIKPQIAGVEGVSQINIYGGNAYAWELQYNPSKLNEYGISTDEIRAAIYQYFKKSDLGRVSIAANNRSGEKEYFNLEMTSPNVPEIDWSAIPVKKSGSRILYLTALADVVFKEQDPQSYYRINGKNAISIEIQAARKVNFIAAGKRIDDKMLQVERQLPSGYTVIRTFDATEFLKTELNKVFRRFFATLFVLLLFVLLISRQFRYLLLISLSLLCNLLLAFILYYFFKLEIHLISIAGISISLGMIIDNSIVVIDHIRHKHNLKVLLAVVGSSLTTVGAICIIFFLDEQQKGRLIDFAWVMIINISVSLIVALFFIPALFEKLPLKPRGTGALIKSKRRVARFNSFYARILLTGIRFRVLLFAVIILTFGIPLFLLPQKIEQEGWWAGLYNKTIGGEFYNDTLKPWLDKGLGGTLRLFLSNKDVFTYQNMPIERTRLHVDARMPYGSGLKQMDTGISSFEDYLGSFKEVSQFKSDIHSGQQASIDIYFTKKTERGIFPYTLKSKLETKAIYTGLADFIITGVGQGFSNQLNLETTNYGFTLVGYNYEKLRRLSDQIRSLLKKNPRVDRVAIGAERDWTGGRTHNEFVFRVNNPEQLLINRVSQASLDASLTAFSALKQEAGVVNYKNKNIPLIFAPLRRTADIWEVMNEPVRSDSGAYVRLKEFASIGKEHASDEVKRENQQYQIVINYNFIGDYYLGSLVAERIIKKINKGLPVGYRVEASEGNFWNGTQSRLTWAIFLTIVIVFIVCAVLLNNFLQSLAVIAMVPVSFIGVFTISWLFGFRFDEGGYAGFIVLTGVVVNAALFILNDYNNNIKDLPRKNKLALYIRSYNSKIIPVLLSTASMIMGMVPFIVGSYNEEFWYALAMSVTGGLFFSLIALFVFLPLLLRLQKAEDKIKERHATK